MSKMLDCFICGLDPMAQRLLAGSILWGFTFLCIAVILAS